MQVGLMVSLRWRSLTVFSNLNGNRHGFKHKNTSKFLRMETCSNLVQQTKEMERMEKSHMLRIWLKLTSLTLNIHENHKQWWNWKEIKEKRNSQRPMLHPRTQLVNSQGMYLRLGTRPVWFSSWEWLKRARYLKKRHYLCWNPLKLPWRSRGSSMHSWWWRRKDPRDSSKRGNLKSLLWNKDAGRRRSKSRILKQPH